jgi:hypothetical protein
MYSSTDAQNITTGGVFAPIYPGSQLPPILLSGVPGTTGVTNPSPNPAEAPPAFNTGVGIPGITPPNLGQASLLSPQELNIVDPLGNSIYGPGLSPSISAIGNGDFLYNPATLYGVLPTTNTTSLSQVTHLSGITTYTGSDLRIILDIADASLPKPTGIRYSKQIIECTTITVSVHRVKSPVRALSYINPKGFARGGRTIAGTLVLTQFTLDVLYKFLQASLWNDTSKDSSISKEDQLPPFNLTMVFADEFGNQSYRRLIGVDIIDDGVIYSSNDSMTEQTLIYQAADFTPLLPYNASAINASPQRQSQKAEMTPTTVVQQQASLNVTNPANAMIPIGSNPATLSTLTPLLTPPASTSLNQFAPLLSGD